MISLKSGSSAELNYLLIGALRAQGITANPVLLSTPNHGYLSLSRPSLTQFNHVIVLVQLQESEQSFLLDATSNDVPGGLLPYHDLVQKGRLMTEESSSWVTITPPADEKTAVQLNLLLTKDGTLSGESLFKMSDYAAMEIRRKLDNESDMPAHLQGWLGLAVSEVEASGFDDLYDDLTITTQVDATSHLIQQEDFYYVPAILAKEFAENPLKAEERTLPIDLITPLEFINITKLSLEEGLMIEELPENTSFSLPDSKARYSISFSDMNGDIQVIEKLSIKDPIYAAEEYNALKKFLDLVIENQQATLIIKRE